MQRAPSGMSTSKQINNGELKCNQLMFYIKIIIPNLDRVACSKND